MRARRPPLGLTLAAVAVAVAMALPVGHLVLRATESDDLVGIATSDRTLELLRSTLWLAGLTTFVTVVVGVGIAWLVERTDLPGRRALGVLAALPLVVPTYVGALAIKAAFGPRGLVAEVPGLLGTPGAVAALALSTYPYVMLLARATLAALDPAAEEAARTLGDTAPRVFRRVIVPALRPSVGAGALLVFLYVLSDFGAVAILGYPTLTRGIFLQYRASFDRTPAAVLGLVLVGVTLVAAVVERRVRGRAAPQRAVAGARRADAVSIGRWRWPAAGAVVTVAAAGVGMPVGVAVYWASVGASTADTSVLLSASGTSLAWSAAAAVVAVALALPVALLAVRHRSVLSRVIETVAVAGYALPGLVIGLALVFFAARYLPAIYQTGTLVIAAYVVRFLPEALGAVRADLSRLDPALEEAARSLGRTRMRATASITLPALRPALVAGGGLVFLTAMKELPATLLLRPAGADTLAVRIWTGASEGLYAQAAPAALILVAVSGLVLWPVLGRLGAASHAGRSAS